MVRTKSICSLETENCNAFVFPVCRAPRRGGQVHLAAHPGAVRRPARQDPPARRHALLREYKKKTP